MRAACRSNARALAAKMRARARAVTVELRVAAAEIAQDLTQTSRLVLNAEVYSSPIPIGARGAPQWRRTGRLLANERFRARGVHVKHENRTPYALARYRLGTSTGRRIRSPSVRVSHWYTTAILRRGSRIQQTRRRAIQRALRAGH